MRTLMTLVLFALSAASFAQPPPPKPCASPEHRQFDFWVGEWIVRNPAGKEAGRNSISKSEDGCVLHERWTSSTSKYRGQSLNIYDAPRKVWHQSWVDNGGLLLLIEGGWRDGAMVLEGDRPAKDGRSERHRITWTPQPDGGLRQLWETSSGPGQDWKILFDGRYSRK
jgi:hypothetical protein